MDESSVGICFQNMGNMRRVSSGVPGTIEKKNTFSQVCFKNSTCNLNKRNDAELCEGLYDSVSII